MRRLRKDGEMRTGFGKSALSGLAAVATMAAAGRAGAQAPAGAPDDAPRATIPAPTAPMPVPNDLLSVTPGGLTNAMVGKRAAATSYTAKANAAALRGAAARVDEAWANFLPRLTGTASYTRLSNFTPPSFSSGSLVGTEAPAGPFQVQPGTTLFSTGPLVFPLVLNNYLLQATITVPISDYFLRLTTAYTSATHSEEAARYDVAAARVASAADGRAAYYAWLRARGAVIVAVQALNDQRDHLKLAQNQFEVGQASKADVLRAETNEASAELQVEHSRNLADLAEKQVRIAMHVPDEVPIVLGEGLEGPLPPVQGNLRELTDEALSTRLEVKSMDANVVAARDQASSAKAQRYPVITGVGDVIEANPNQRVFPLTPRFFPTWDLGAKLVWSPNDVLLGNGTVNDLESRAVQLEAQKGTLIDNIRLDVQTQWQAVREADISIESSGRELTSAQEAYRVARELFNNGRGTSTTLTDAETDLTRSRLDLLNARVDARTARVRLEHALGRDVRMAAESVP
jgi:outer membrane protein TolC